MAKTIGSIEEHPVEVLCTINNEDVIVRCKDVIGTSKQIEAYFNPNKYPMEASMFGFDKDRCTIKQGINNTIVIACLTTKENDLKLLVKAAKKVLGEKSVPNFASYEEALRNL